LATSNWLPFDEPDKPLFAGLPDADARAHAVDPSHNVVLEASAGTGKTRVLVDRYLNLLGRGVDPANILAITFTRKAAAEMRGRILSEIVKRAKISPANSLWRAVRQRAGDISISTIDAFCLSLLHEFPLEANLDPGFEIADETQIPRLLDEALDRALDVGRRLTRTDEDVRLLFAELRESRLREALGAMIDRRLVVEGALERALDRAPRDLSADRACGGAFERLRNAFRGLSGGVDGFLANGPIHQQRWNVLAGDMRTIVGGTVPDNAAARGVLDRVEEHFLNREGAPRQRFDRYAARDCRSAEAWKLHRTDVLTIGPDVAEAFKAFRRDLNAVLSRGARRLYRVALDEYRRTLESYGVLDFSETLAQALLLLAQMDEFSRSRYRLEGRYHHVLLDEFQDTSRAQWALVALLIRSWGEGSGIADTGALVPSIFLVGDRKQSIYGFRDADAGVMQQAGDFVDALRPGRDSRRAISNSFRAVPQLLAFANDLFDEVEKEEGRHDAFRFGPEDRFPVEMPVASADVLGMIAAATAADCAAAVSAEIRRLLDAGEQVRDPESGVQRPVRPRDIAILFRTKDSHQDFEKALEAREIPSYVYKGLGFFEADEIKDVLALLRYLAAPESDIRAAAFLRSRFVRLSDRALQALAPRLAFALSASSLTLQFLDQEDRVILERTRRSVRRWLTLVDWLPPAELLETIVDETAYLFETRGPRAGQARENLKKIRGMVRRVQNRGYATLARVATYLDRLTAGDESNAVVDAGDSVSLMTIHAAKGLEFPIVFVVNLTKGTGTRRQAIRVVSEGEEDGQAWLSIGDFQSDADQDTKVKDREETKRLLYVAVTRARDRVFLASEVKDGRFRAFGGSLGDVIPVSLRTLFETASLSPTAPAHNWAAVSGETHRFRVCGAPATGLTNLPPRSSQGNAQKPPGSANFAPVADPSAIPRVAVTEFLRPGERSARGESGSGDRHRDLAGRLVHRLMERFGTSLSNGPDREAISAHLVALLQADEMVAAADKEPLFEAAADAYLSLSATPVVADALASGEALFEVPFSFHTVSSPMIVRGTFDCLVRRRDGGILVLEFKTGYSKPEDAEQLSIYLAAARALFPGTSVEGHIIYARKAGVDHRPLHSDH
jgi:ATP-dependent helicase/nuclease subunit A